ncbi:MAG: glycosyl transferase family 1 [Candidatus Binatia bacterium]|nr:MAG: glycosyl transferase family 1 [Candidatus Binatia bacterium]
MRDLLLLNERDLEHPNAGGAEVNLFEVTSRLVRLGYRATLLCTRFPGAAAETEIRGVRVVRFGNRFTYYLRFPFRMRRFLGPETVIIEHLCKLPFLTPLLARRPMLAVTHHLFGTTAFQQVPAPVAAVVVASEWLIPVFYRNSTFLAVSPSTREDLVRRGIPAERIVVVPNGVDCSHYRPPAEPPPPPPTVLVLGRVEPYKRLDLALRAFRRVREALPESRLVVVGGGTGLEAARREVERLGLRGAVTLTGPVSEEEKLRRMAEAHVAVNTSEKEGWGLTVLEAAACGIPTVASDVPGLRDSVVNGQTGVLVRHGDVEGVAVALVGLLRDEAERRRLGRNARLWAETFSWDAVAEATAECIESVARGDPELPRFSWFGGEPVPGRGEARREGAGR